MMVKPSVTELLTKTSNRYELVIATSKRARQIVDKRLEEKKADKEANVSIKDKDRIKEEPAVTVAAEEIANGTVQIVGEEGQEIENQEMEEQEEQEKQEAEDQIEEQ